MSVTEEGPEGICTLMQNRGILGAFHNTAVSCCVQMSMELVTNSLCRASSQKHFTALLMDAQICHHRSKTRTFIPVGKEPLISNVKTSAVDFGSPPPKKINRNWCNTVTVDHSTQWLNSRGTSFQTTVLSKKFFWWDRPWNIWKPEDDPILWGPGIHHRRVARGSPI